MLDKMFSSPGVAINIVIAAIAFATLAYRLMRRARTEPRANAIGRILSRDDMEFYVNFLLAALTIAAVLGARQIAVGVYWDNPGRNKTVENFLQALWQWLLQ